MRQDEQPIPPDPDVVVDAFGLGPPTAVPTFAARGELGRIWRFETTLGTWAVKELLHFDPARVEPDARRDVAFQLAAIAAGVSMPHPVTVSVAAAQLAVPTTGVNFATL
jgi:hypothetical protein